MVLFHNVFDLVQVFFWELITVFKNATNFVVYSVKWVKVLLLKMALLGFVCEQRNLISYFFIVFDRNFHSSIFKVEQFKQFKWHFTVFALISRSYILIFTVSANFFFFEVPIRRHCVDSSSFHLIPSGSWHFLFFILFQFFLWVLIVKSDRLMTSVVIWIIECFPFFRSFLFGMSFDMLHNLR